MVAAGKHSSRRKAFSHLLNKLTAVVPNAGIMPSPELQKENRINKTVLGPASSTASQASSIS
jgi:hypothetical protein